MRQPAKKVAYTYTNLTANKKSGLVSKPHVMFLERNIYFSRPHFAQPQNTPKRKSKPQYCGPINQIPTLSIFSVVHRITRNRVNLFACFTYTQTRFFSDLENSCSCLKGVFVYKPKSVSRRLEPACQSGRALLDLC